MKKLMCVAAAMVAGVAMAKGMLEGQDALKQPGAKWNVWNLSFVQKSVNQLGSKVETETLKGVLLIDGNKNQKVYVWNPKQKTDFINEYIKPGKNGEYTMVKLPYAKTADLTIKSNTLGSKTQLVASFYNTDDKWYGVGTGAVDKKSNCKSIAGNMLTFTGAEKPAGDAYGTWKATFDATCSSIYRGDTKVKNPKTKAMMDMTGNKEYILSKKGAISQAYIMGVWDN